VSIFARRDLRGDKRVWENVPTQILIKNGFFADFPALVVVMYASPK